MTTNPTKVAVVGAGGVGMVVAAAGVAAGSDVTVCVRSPVPSLQLVDADGVETVPARVVSDPSELDGPFDLVFFTVKAPDTAGAAGWLSALAGPSSLVVAVQNGLDHEARLAPHVPDGTPVVPALAYFGAERLGPGRVRRFEGRLLQVPTPHAERVAAAVDLKVKGTDDMLTASWRKLLANVIANPLTCLTMRRIDVMGEPGIADLARGLLAETVAVGRAEGAHLSEDDIEPMVAGTAQYGTAVGSSMLYDRLAGRPLEHQYITGEVVRRGARHGIPTPLSSAVLALLEALDAGLRTSASSATDAPAALQGSP